LNQTLSISYDDVILFFRTQEWFGKFSGFKLWLPICLQAGWFYQQMVD